MSSSDAHPTAWIVLVTGMSGSGKTTAVQSLEDQGFFCIDNLPPSLAKEAVAACLNARDRRSRIALVLDARSGQLLEDVPRAVDELRAAGHVVDVFFLDASDEVLIRRFSETRRRHPLDGQTLVESIVAERQALIPVRDLATRVLDTSSLNRHELSKLTRDGVAQQSDGKTLSMTLVSFGFKFGLPVGADMVLDARHLRNPHFDPVLKAFTGTDRRVRDYVMADDNAREFLHRIHDLLRHLVPLYQREGKRYLTVAIGCTGGKHRSVTLVEHLNEALSSPPLCEGAVIGVRHRDIER
jgi:RNase adapter protein RapZ